MYLFKRNQTMQLNALYFSSVSFSSIIFLHFGQGTLFSCNCIQMVYEYVFFILTSMDMFATSYGVKLAIVINIWFVMSLFFLLLVGC